MSEKSDTILLELENAVKNSDVDGAGEAARKALQARVDPIDAIEKGLNKGLREVGERFGKGELFIVDLIAAAEAMKSAMAILEPEILKRKKERKVLAKIVIGTVEGDIHDIGKNMVSVMLTAAGSEVCDVGKDVAAETFVQKAREIEAGIVGASSLMTTTMPAQKHLADALSRSGLKVSYIVGGSAVSEQWAKEISAYYAADATSSVGLVKRLVGVEA
jgi:corrinoid protein of di/trimethylamine methyltransferase